MILRNLNSLSDHDIEKVINLLKSNARIEKDETKGKFLIKDRNANWLYIYSGINSIYNPVFYSLKDGNPVLSNYFTPIYSFSKNSSLDDFNIYYNYTIIVLDKVKGTLLSRFTHTPNLNDIDIIKEDYLSIKKAKNDRSDIMLLNLFYLEVRLVNDTYFVGFKYSYINYIVNIKVNQKITQSSFNSSYLDGKTLESKLQKLFDPYKDKSVDSIKKEFKIESNAKSINRILIDRILSIEENKLLSELAKADIEVKTISMNKNRKVKESISLPTFRFKDIIQTDWEVSKLYKYFKNKTFMFALFMEIDNISYFKGLIFWKFEYEVINNEIKSVWIDTVKKINKGEIIKFTDGNTYTSNFIGIKDSSVIHVRPHARNRDDTYSLPMKDKLTGISKFVKQSFWINSKYIEEIVNLKGKKLFAKVEVIDNTINLKPSLYIDNSRCEIDYYREGNVCYDKSFKNIKDAIFDYIITNSQVPSSFNEDIINDEIDNLKYKSIIIEHKQSNYTVRYFMDLGLDFKKSTKCIELISRIMNNTPLDIKELVSLMSENQLNTILNNFKLSVHNFLNTKYVSNTKKFNNLQSIYFILSIVKSCSISEFIKLLQELTLKELNRQQIISAVRNSGCYFDSDLDKIYLDKTVYYDELWK